MKLTFGKLIGLVGVLAVIGIFVFRINASLHERALAGNAIVSVASVTTAAPERRAMTKTLSLTGVVRPANEVDIFAKLPGRVERVRVKVGDRVKAGDVLAEMEERDIALQVKQAEAQLQSAQAMLEKAQVDVKLAEQTATRMRNLHKENALSQAELEKAESGALAAKTGLALNQAQAAVAESALLLMREQLANRRVTTPVAGTVTKRTVNIGTMATPAMAAFQVQDVSALKLEGGVEADDFMRLKLGQAVEIHIDGHVATAGKISSLSPTLDPQTRRAAVEIAIDNQGGRLLANMLASAVITLGTVDNLLSVPAAAIVTLPTGRCVYVVREEKAVLVQPSLGVEDQGFIEVKSGLTDKDRVVISGHNTLGNGAQVKVMQ